MWNPLSGMTKTVIAATLAGGVLITGIAWQGANSINEVKKNLDNMASELKQAISDRDFLAEKYNNLKALYFGVVDNANSKIDQLAAQRDELRAKVLDLKEQLAAKANDEQSEKDALQAEINRLESELDKANKQISDLESYAKAKDAEQDYKPIDKSKYDAGSIDRVHSIGYVTIDDKAQGNAKAETMAQEEHVKAIEQDFADHGITVNISGVTLISGTMDGVVPAYVVDNFQRFEGKSNGVNALLDEIRYEKVYFTDSSKTYKGWYLVHHD